MPKFNIAIHPALRTEFGPQIDLSLELKNTVVECKLDGLRAAMQETAKGIVSPVPEKPSLYVYASPTGRSPNGWMNLKHAGETSMVINPAAAEAALSKIIESAEAI